MYSYIQEAIRDTLVAAMDFEIMTREITNLTRRLENFIQEDRHRLPDENFTKYNEFKLMASYEKLLRVILLGCPKIITEYSPYKTSGFL